MYVGKYKSERKVLPIPLPQISKAHANRERYLIVFWGKRMIGSFIFPKTIANALFQYCNEQI